MDSARIGKYRILEHLAVGGMGEVFLARREGPAGFAKTVVVKRILKNLANNESFIQMFIDEARLAATLEHPNIVQIFELGFEGGCFFIAMEFIHGRSLRQVRERLALTNRTLPPAVLARICSQALQGLHYAHTLRDEQGRPLGVIHRDVSPENVLVGFNGTAKLVDFGIAKAAVNQTTTSAGTVKGKFAYMSPEQITGGDIDGRADVYAMGVLLYELLAGQRPYSASSELGLVRAILEVAPPPPSALDPSIPEALDRIVMRALSKDRDTRFATADEMAMALEVYIQSLGRTLTPSHVSAFLRELYPTEAEARVHLAPTPAPMPRVPTPAPSSLPEQPALRGEPGSKSASEASFQFDAEPEFELVVEDQGLRPARRLPRIAVPLGLTALIAVAGVLLWLGLPPATSFPAPTSAGAATAAVSDRAGDRPLHSASAEVETAEGREGAPLPATAIGDRRSGSRGQAEEVDPDQSPAPGLRAGSEREAVSGPAVAGTRLTPEHESSEQRDPPTSARSPSPSRRGSRDSASTRRSGTRQTRTRGAAHGQVMLRINPWAEVFHEGRSLGLTPMEALNLPEGEQVLVLKNAELNIQRELVVRVNPGEQLLVKLDLLD